MSFRCSGGVQKGVKSEKQGKQAKNSLKRPKGQNRGNPAKTPKIEGSRAPKKSP